MCLLLCRNLRPQSFYLSPEFQKSGQAVIQSAMQNSCLASRNLNNKEEDMTAVTASTAGDPNSTNQKHETRLWAMDDGGFHGKEEQLSCAAGKCVVSGDLKNIWKKKYSCSWCLNLRNPGKVSWKTMLMFLHVLASALLYVNLLLPVFRAAYFLMFYFFWPSKPFQFSFL